MQNQGIFISFEGIDGAGKSTHIEALASLFKAHGRVVTRTREPGGTELAEKLRTLILNDAMDPLTEALLIFAARRDHVVQLIGPALQRGEVVLCDRFTDASFAYQGAGRGFDLNILATLEAWVSSGSAAVSGELMRPDLTLWFDLSPEQAAERLKSARLPDRFESQPLEFFRRVTAGYARRQHDEPERLVRVDGGQEQALVWRQVQDVVKARGWLH